MTSLKNKMEDDYNEECMYGSTLPIYTRTIPIQIHKVMLDEPIGKPSYYRGIVNVLDAASENDIIEFHLITPGGNLDTALLIRDAIRTTAARTIAIVHGSVASAGTIPMLSCDDVMVMPLSTVMVHPATWGAVNTSKNMSDYSTFSHNYLNRVYSEVYEGFMTEQEISNMIDSNRDVWMEEDEVLNRLYKRDLHFMEKEQKENEVKPAVKKAAAKKVTQKKQS